MEAKSFEELQRTISRKMLELEDLQKKHIVETGRRYILGQGYFYDSKMYIDKTDYPDNAVAHGELSKLIEIASRWKAMCELLDGREVDFYMLSYSEVNQLAELMDH
jgi:hypothetical protein